ncbi:hypothetical protein [Nonomuraea basaltis]|uniref:hypothetical protein n=1 Tax=Nonomuraea basaltis TaxID=2495887 RepID=UPI00110C5509|nr:hypothetical protein [Nonomuraea basaltis]TMR90985.1 hypothetical protein EJK15_52330 [Nonomuraea basaltis]
MANELGKPNFIKGVRAMPIRRGVLAGLALGTAITGGTLALGATTASADNPNDTRHASEAVTQRVPVLRGIPFLPARQEEREEDDIELIDRISVLIDPLPVQNCVNIPAVLGVGGLARPLGTSEHSRCVNVPLFDEPSEDK